jgi:hypothetical protein
VLAGVTIKSYTTCKPVNRYFGGTYHFHLHYRRFNRVRILHSGLRRLEVTFPPHYPSDAGSIPADVVEFFRTEKFGNKNPSEGTLSCLTRVVDLLHVKDPQVPKGNRWAKLRTLSVQEVDHVTARGVSSAVLW